MFYLQPFYSVMVDNKDKPGNQTTYGMNFIVAFAVTPTNSSLLVAQENILISEEATPIVFNELGKYFDGFDASTATYIPNQELATQYPEL